jgi:hypothetical protein
MSTDESAATAIEKMNKCEFEGRVMFVSESHSTGEGSRGNNNSGNRRFGRGTERKSFS